MWFLTLFIQPSSWAYGTGPENLTIPNKYIFFIGRPEIFSSLATVVESSGRDFPIVIGDDQAMEIKQEEEDPLTPLQYSWARLHGKVKLFLDDNVDMANG